MNKYNELEISRYYGVIFDNVVTYRYSSVFASSTSPELFMAVPYNDLIDKLKSHVGLGEDESPNVTQQFRNYLSALNGYLAFCGKTVDSNIGVELSTKFEQNLADYLASIDVAPRTQTDRARLLKVMQRIYQDGLSARPAKQEKHLGTLALELRRHVAGAGVAPKTLAKQAGVDPTTLRGWLAGATPRNGTLPALRRLEHWFGLERDTLVQLIEEEPNAASKARTVLAFRERHHARTQRGMGLAEDELTDAFLQEWRAFYEYKVSGFPTLERQSNAQWRQIPRTMSILIGGLAKRGNLVCPSADMFLSKLRQFLGVIFRLQPDMGGIAWGGIPAQSLAFCAYPQALECYLQWLTDQSDGIRHRGHKVFAGNMASLLRPETGYLWQQPAVFRARLPEEIRPQTDGEWKKMCEHSHKLLRAYIRTSTGTSRSPEEPIADLLALPEPFSPVLSAIQRIQEKAAESSSGGIVQARHKRDALLLSLLLSNPLRVRTLASLTWSPNGQGSLRGSPTSGWRIVLQATQLKNGASQARAYSVKVADWVKPLLDEYIEEYRETLLAGTNCAYLFVGDKEGEIWEGMTKTVLKLTRRYIPGSPGFGPHAFRHLVATTWLRKNPGDFLTVAELLNDNLSTVLANYAHLRKDDSFARYEAQMNLGR